jgi:hypothetical protein
VLENEMLEFKDSLAEWKSMPSLLHIEESTTAAGDHAWFPFRLLRYLISFQIVAATFAPLWPTFASFTPTKCKTSIHRSKVRLNMCRRCQGATLLRRWMECWR